MKSEEHTTSQRGNLGHHYIECGLHNVWLQNGFEYVESHYGRTLKVEDLDGLHRCIAMCLVKKPEALTGDEFRFLRTELDLSQSSLASLFGVTDRTIREWESEDSLVSEPVNTFVRFIYKQRHKPDENLEEMSKHIRHMQALDRELHELKLQLKIHKSNESGWKAEPYREAA